MSEQGICMSEKQYMLTDFDNEVEMLEKINEQQDTITEQEEHIKLLTKTIERMTKKINKIYKLSASERSV